MVDSVLVIWLLSSRGSALASGGDARTLGAVLKGINRPPGLSQPLLSRCSDALIVLQPRSGSWPPMPSHVV